MPFSSSYPQISNKWWRIYYTLLFILYMLSSKQLSLPLIPWYQNLKARLLRLTPEAVVFQFIVHWFNFRLLLWSSYIHKNTYFKKLLLCIRAYHPIAPPKQISSPAYFEIPNAAEHVSSSRRGKRLRVLIWVRRGVGLSLREREPLSTTIAFAPANTFL